MKTLPDNPSWAKCRLNCGGEMSLERIFEALYRAVRYRREQAFWDGKVDKCTVVDAMMSPTMRTYFCAILKRDLARKYGPNAVVLTKPEVGGNPDIMGGIVWSTFDLAEYGFRIAAIETKTLCSPADDEIWCIDWSDISWGGEFEHPERHVIFTNVKELK